MRASDTATLPQISEQGNGLKCFTLQTTRFGETSKLLAVGEPQQSMCMIRTRPLKPKDTS